MSMRYPFVRLSRDERVILLLLGLFDSSLLIVVLNDFVPSILFLYYVKSQVNLANMEVPRQSERCTSVSYPALLESIRFPSLKIYFAPLAWQTVLFLPVLLVYVSLLIWIVKHVVLVKYLVVLYTYHRIAVFVPFLFHE